MLRTSVLKRCNMPSTHQTCRARAPEKLNRVMNSSIMACMETHSTDTRPARICESTKKIYRYMAKTCRKPTPMMMAAYHTACGYRIWNMEK